MNFISFGSANAYFFNKYKNTEIQAIQSFFNINTQTIITEAIPEKYLEGLGIRNRQELSNICLKNWFDLDKVTEKIDYVIVDFLDERFDSLVVNGKYITKTPIVEKSRWKENELIDDEVNLFNDKWKNSCKKFLYELEKSIPKRNIILHEVYLAKQYLKDDIFVDFPNKKEIENINLSLENKYNYFKKINPEMTTVKLEENLVYSTYQKYTSASILGNQYFERLYDYIYNTYDKEMALYKIPFFKAIEEKNELCNTSFSIFNDTATLNLKNVEKSQLLCYWIMNDTPIDKYPPKLKQGGKYTLEIEKSDLIVNLDLTIEFYNTDNQLIYHKNLTTIDSKFVVPKDYKKYIIYLFGNGNGEIELKYLKLMRHRGIGYLTAQDSTIQCDNSEDIHYLFEKVDNSDHLIVSFHGFNTVFYQTSYENMGILKNVNASKLFLLDDYDINGRIYLDKNRKDSLQQNISSLILDISSELGIQKENIIMLGASKGGTAAIYYGMRLSVGNIIAMSPPIYLSIWKSWKPYSQVFYKNIPGNCVDDDMYMDSILENIVLQNDKSTLLHFLCISNDIYFKGYFKKFENFLNAQNISYEITLKEGDGHSDLPKFVAPFINEKLELILR